MKRVYGLSCTCLKYKRTRCESCTITSEAVSLSKGSNYYITPDKEVFLITPFRLRFGVTPYLYKGQIVELCKTHVFLDKVPSGRSKEEAVEISIEEACTKLGYTYCDHCHSLHLKDEECTNPLSKVELALLHHRFTPL